MILRDFLEDIKCLKGWKLISEMKEEAAPSRGNLMSKKASGVEIWVLVGG